MADAYYENKPKGEYGVLYFRVAGKRKRVSLGYAKTKSAKAAHEKQRQFVAELEIHKAANQKLTLDLQQTLEMYAEKNPKFVNDLEAKGLLELLDEKPKMTLGELRDEWFEMIRLTTKPRTARTYRQAITPFVNFMPDDCLISDVTTGDVVDFEAETIANGTASTTLGNYLKRTKAAFAYAVKLSLIHI